MNAQTQIDENLQIDPEEYDMVALFNCLGLDEQGQAQLIDAWQSTAPSSKITDFARALIIGGAKLAHNL